MAAEIGTTEAAQFSGKEEYINGILLQCGQSLSMRFRNWALLGKAKFELVEKEAIQKQILFKINNILIWGLLPDIRKRKITDPIVFGRVFTRYDVVYLMSLMYPRFTRGGEFS